MASACAAGAWRAATGRRGLTILEVLIAIGVVSIGLFGVLAVIPLAAYRTGQALTTDRAATLGRNAAAEFDVRGMGRREFQFYDATNWGQPFATANALCLDPRLVSRHNGAVTGGFDSRVFPYYPVANAAALVNQPRMTRLTLRSGAGLNLGLSPRLADEIFMAQDDLVFNYQLTTSQERDLLLPPRQEFATDAVGAMGAPVGVKRQSDGQLSWMATLAPHDGGDPNTYLLSVVVFSNRSAALPLDGVTERIARCSFFGTGLYGGGDARLSPDPAGAGVVEAKEGEWILLAQGNQFRWYRLAQVSPEAQADGSRDVTLQGPPWNTTLAPAPQAVIVPGVVAVYEKTVRMETTSLWTQ